LHGLDQSGKVLYIHNFWKMLYPLTAMGYLVIPHNFVDAFVQTKQHVNRFFSSAEQRVLADFISEGHLERHWHKTRAIYKKRRQAVIFALRQTFRNSISFFGEGAGLHITVRFAPPQSTDDLACCADAVGFPMVSTLDYYAFDAVENEFLVPFCVIPEEKALELVTKFAQELQQKYAEPVHRQLVAVT
jgi:GntR family transcriptional regulator/MocR family aminotransferase